MARRGGGGGGGGAAAACRPATISLGWSSADQNARDGPTQLAPAEPRSATGLLAGVPVRGRTASPPESLFLSYLHLQEQPFRRGVCGCALWRLLATER